MYKYSYLLTYLVVKTEDEIRRLRVTSSRVFGSATKAGQALSEGQILLDQLLLPVKDAKGQDVTPADRKQQVALVDDTVGTVQQRRGRCDELSEVRRLKLQQLLQLRTCERDIDQVS